MRHSGRAKLLFDGSGLDRLAGCSIRERQNGLYPVTSLLETALQEGTSCAHYAMQCPRRLGLVSSPDRRCCSRLSSEILHRIGGKLRRRWCAATKPQLTHKVTGLLVMMPCAASFLCHHVGQSSHSSVKPRNSEAGTRAQTGLQVHTGQPLPD